MGLLQHYQMILDDHISLFISSVMFFLLLTKFIYSIKGFVEVFITVSFLYQSKRYVMTLNVGITHLCFLHCLREFDDVILYIAYLKE